MHLSYFFKLVCQHSSSLAPHLHPPLPQHTPTPHPQVAKPYYQISNLAFKSTVDRIAKEPVIGLIKWLRPKGLKVCSYVEKCAEFKNQSLKKICWYTKVLCAKEYPRGMQYPNPKYSSHVISMFILAPHLRQQSQLGCLK